jgi:hypothetical protein
MCPARAMRSNGVEMPFSDLFLKIEIEHDDDENPERLADEICRTIQRKIYGVRSAELSSYVTHREKE